jgi:hypothetical protein
MLGVAFRLCETLLVAELHLAMALSSKPRFARDGERQGGAQAKPSRKKHALKARV